MPFSSGTFSRVHDWTSDRDAGIKISASRTDAEFDGIATALTSTMLKDGSQTLTAMIPFTLGLSVPTDKKLQLRDSNIFLNSSASGQADLVANSVIQVTAPTVNIEASTAITLESDAITLGENGDTDIVLTFNANSADGVITWKEDEDYFLLSDDILMNSTEKIQFGDTASFIQQSSDGVLQIDGEATVNVNASTAFTVTTDTATFTSANANDPVVIIKNTTNDTAGSRLHFVKDKGAAGAASDDIGIIEFISDDDVQTQTSFAKIVGEVSRAGNTDEAGKLSFFVAESDGTTTALTAGLVIEGEHDTDGEVDVTIGAGSGSTTAIIGNLGIGTTSPAQQLHIDESASNSHATMRLEGNNRGGKIEMYQGSTIVSDIQSDQSGNLYFNTSGAFGNTTVSTKLTLGTAGDLTVNTGNLVIGTGGKGIDFTQATNDSEMTSELLDDYEEGLATMAFSPGAGSIGINTAYEKLSYTKIGRMVHMNGQIAANGISGLGTGNTLQITGLPFAAQDLDDNAGRAGFYVQHDAMNMVDGREIFGFINEGGAVINIFEQNSSGASNKAEIITASGSLYFSFTYNTAS
jgi:hypothetical protein